MSKIKLSTPINIVSGLTLILAISAGISAATTSNKTVKNISLVASWSLAAVAVSNKVVGTYLEQSADNQMLDETNKLTKELREVQDKAYRLENSEKFVREINSKSEKEIANLKQQLLNNEQTIETLNATLTGKITEFSNLSKDRDNRVELLYKAAITHVLEVVDQRVDSSYESLHSATNTKLENDFYSASHKKLAKYIDTLNEAEESHQRVINYLKKLATVRIENNDELLGNIQQAFRLQDKVFMDIANLKVKYRGILNIGAELSNYQLIDEREKHLHNNKVLKQYQALTTKAREDFDNLSQREFEQREQAIQGIDDAIARIEEVRKTNVQLNQRLLEISKPQLWRTATRDDYRMGNLIINYFEKLGYTFDKYDTDYKGFEGTIWLDAYRSKKRVIVKDLNEHGEYLQQLCHSFNIPEFKYEPDRDKFSCYLQFSTKPKKEKGSELPRGVRPTSQFPKIVSKWKRVRITGGSESGKSPTAENVAVCMLKANPGTIDFYDPMYASVKNYRTIPAVGHSHEDSIKGLQQYGERMKNAPSNQFYLAWFDEIDTTIDENRDSVKDVKAVIKQASHKNSGLILTGQNANVSALKGLQRSDMNNLVLVHIGSNYRDGIDNSSLSSSEKDHLKKLGDELTEYCHVQNEKLDMEATGSNANPNAYRFALVLEPQRRGYYLILPEFGKYTFDEIEDTNSQLFQNISTRTPSSNIEYINSKSEFGVNEVLSNQPEKPSKCPECGSTTITEIESYRDGRKRFRCGKGHKFGFEDC